MTRNGSMYGGNCSAYEADRPMQIMPIVSVSRPKPNRRERPMFLRMSERGLGSGIVETRRTLSDGQATGAQTRGEARASEAIEAGVDLEKRANEVAMRGFTGRGFP